MVVELFDLAFLIVLVTAIIALVFYIQSRRIPAIFQSLLRETELYSNPKLKSLQGEELPLPVAKYLQIISTISVSEFSFVEVDYSGYQRVRPHLPLLPTSGKNYYTLARPGFCSRAKISWHSPLWVEISQRYSINDGYVVGKICSIILIFSMMGLRMSRLCLSRYFSEAVWYPWILASSPNHYWESIDGQSARLRVSYHPLMISFIVRFHEGQIQSYSSLGEYRDRNGTLIPYERIVSFGDYRKIHGVYLPFHLKTVWKCPKKEIVLQDLVVGKILYHSKKAIDT